MLLVNIAGTRVRTDEFGGLDVPPGGTCEVADGYCRAGLGGNGARRPSAVERLAAGLVPVDLAERARWGLPVPPEPPAPLTVAETAAELEAEGLPPAVAALVATGEVETPPEKPRRRRKRQGAW